MKRIATLVASAAIAIAGMTPATPAAAITPQDQDVLKIVLGLAALGIIARELTEDHGDRKNQPAKRYPYGSNGGGFNGYFPNPNPYRPNPYRSGPWQTGPGWHGAVPEASRTIPARCVVEYRDRGRTSQVVSERCFERGRRVADLPKACEVDLNTKSGRGDIYGMNCLRGRGYQISGYR